MFYKSVFIVLLRDIIVPIFEADRVVHNFLVSLQYFMVPCSAQFMKRLGIEATFGKSLEEVCYSVSRPLSSAILNFLRV